MLTLKQFNVVKTWKLEVDLQACIFDLGIIYKQAVVLCIFYVIQTSTVSKFTFQQEKVENKFCMLFL